MRIMLTLLGALWALGAQAQTVIVLDSAPGDYIGAAQQRTLTAPEWSISYDGDTGFISLWADGASFWSLEFQAPRGASFATPARFAGATRYPFNSATEPGLSVSGEGRGCNQLTGWFEVVESLFDASGALARLALDFRQNCDNAAGSLYGAVRINSEVPVDLEAPRAVAGRAQAVFGRDAVVLDGRQSFSRSTSPLSYTWEQLSGTPVTLRGANTALADFTAPLVPPGGETLRFRLSVATADGRSDADIVEVRVGSKSDPQTYIEFRSDPGDFIGQGRRFRLTSQDGDITAAVNFRGGVSLSYQGSTWFNLLFGPQLGAPFSKGAYENAQRFAFADAGSPGMDVSGDGRGCTAISGRFDVLDVLTANDVVARFAVDFEQHCESSPAALFGIARYNYVPDDIPVARAGSDRRVQIGETVVLDGAQSSDDGGLVFYAWRQRSGPAVVLDDADTVSAVFVAPEVSTPQTMVFELLVADAGDLTAADTVSIEVVPKASGGGALDLRGFAVLIWLSIVAAHRRDRARSLAR
jgi:hypothetical protein